MFSYACYRCRFHNFARNRECFECQTERPRDTGRSYDRRDSSRGGGRDREFTRSSYGEVEERGRPSYGRSDDRGRAPFERSAERGRPQYTRSEERGRPSYDREDVQGRSRFGRSEERSRPSYEEDQEVRSFGRDEGVVGKRTKHEEWTPKRSDTKTSSRFNFDMSDDSDNNLGDSLTSDDEDFGFGDKDDDSDFESSQPISSRKTSGRVNDSLGSRNSNFARSRGGRSSDGPPSRGRSSWERDVSQTSDDEEFEDLDFGMDDDDDDEEDFAPRGAALKRGGSGRDSRGRGGRGRGGSFSGRDPVPGRFWAAADDDFEPEGIYPSSSVTIDVPH